MLVVDDGSTDGSRALLAERFPDVRVLALGANRGFARAANAGIAAVSAEAVALVNTDIVLAPDWLERAAAALSAAPRAAAVATKLLDLGDPTLLYDAGDVLRRDGVCEQRGRFERDGGRYDAPGEVFSACAGAALYRRAAVLDAGGFEERFGTYLEDVDLGLRLRLAGWRCRWEPRAVARHAGGGSSAALPTAPAPGWSATRCSSSRARSRSAGCPSWPTGSSPGPGTPRAGAGCAPTWPASAWRCRCCPAFLRERRALRSAAVVPVEDAVPRAADPGPARRRSSVAPRALTSSRSLAMVRPHAAAAVGCRARRRAGPRGRRARRVRGHGPERRRRPVRGPVRGAGSRRRRRAAPSEEPAPAAPAPRGDRDAGRGAGSSRGRPGVTPRSPSCRAPASTPLRSSRSAPSCSAASARRIALRVRLRERA